MTSHVTLLLIVFATIFAGFSKAQESTSEKCQCALFAKETENPTRKTPIASKSPNFDLTCDAEGKEKCKEMCKALAIAQKEKEKPEKLCEYVPDADHFVPHVYFKTCSEPEWHFTGLEPSIQICCKGKQMITCT